MKDELCVGSVFRAKIRWLCALAKASFRLDLTFRAGWFLDLFGRLAQFAFTVLFFDLIYGGRPSVAGLSWGDMMVLLGTYQCVRSISAVLFSATSGIGGKVQDGTLDYDLLKPLGARLLVSVGRVRTPRIVEVAVGIALVVKGLGPGHGARFWNWVCFGILILLGAWIKYCLVFILNCTSFWFVETYGLYGLFDQVFDLARYPSSVFKGLWGILFSYLLPVTLVSGLPFSALIKAPTLSMFAFAGVHAVFWYVLGQAFWTAALRRYSGASA